MLNLNSKKFAFPCEKYKHEHVKKYTLTCHSTSSYKIKNTSKAWHTFANKKQDAYGKSSKCTPLPSKL